MRLPGMMIILVRCVMQWLVKGCTKMASVNTSLVLHRVSLITLALLQVCLIANSRAHWLQKLSQVCEVEKQSNGKRKNRNDGS